MKLSSFWISCIAVLLIAGCGEKFNPQAEAPPPAQVEHEENSDVVQVDHPEQFQLATAMSYAARSQLVATSVVSSNVSGNIPVISLATGRVVAIHARLGDQVQKGQLLLSIQSTDVSGAYSDYQKAEADEGLARAQLDRSKDLFAHGAISMNDLQVAQDAEEKAKVDVDTAAEHLRVIGSDPDKPDGGTVNIFAPSSGVITDQQVVNAGGVQALGSNPFTISDLSTVWVLCDVHENDLGSVRVGDSADIRLTAYPERTIQGRVSNIGSILDPNTRTAKVRVEVRNPGYMRLGMFATVTFHGQKAETHTQIPATAILQLHDRDWVFVPSGGNRFQRVQIVTGNMLPDNMQEILSGLMPGAKIVQNALAFENTVEQ